MLLLVVDYNSIRKKKKGVQSLTIVLRFDSVILWIFDWFSGVFLGLVFLFTLLFLGHLGFFVHFVWVLLLYTLHFVLCFWW